MNFDVIWTSAAEQELADLWLDPAIRNEVTTASHTLDQQLQANAPNVGESRPNGRRIAFETPLGILFRIDPPGNVVRVLHVWRI